VNGSHVLAAQADGMDRQQMRELVDALRNKWKSAVVVLASVEDSTVSIVSAVTKDLTSKVHAGKLAARWRKPWAAKAAAVPIWRRAAARIRRLCPPRSNASTPKSRASCDANRFDAIVVGAGPTGLACGIELQQRGIRTC
jgi:hypothetical protein